MRSFQALLAVLSLVQSSGANPFPIEYDGILLNRRCDKACGYYSQLCCASSQTCGMNSAGQAVCLDSAQAESGSWQYFTTTFTRTDFVTVVSTGSSYVTPPPVATASCSLSLGESQCGSSCCNAAEICQNGVCIAGSTPGATATAPLRPTSGATVTQIATTTLGFTAPVDTNGATVIAPASSGGLSGGAIAGIVIGVIAGLVLLLILCIWCCWRGTKGIFDGLLGIFGFGPRRRRDTTFVEERYPSII
jgi:hypothetical protein